MLAEAAHKTGRAKADFELREISREEYDRAELAKKYEVIASELELYYAVDQFEEQLVKQVADEVHRETRRLKRFTYLSYFFYPAGVLIGVLGQLAGVKPAGGE